jgi:uncharacterized short protein YbdD (DUF466 family)
LICIISHDYISAIHARTYGKSIKTFSEWSGSKFHPMVQQMVAYANYVDHQRKDSEADTVVMVEAINFDRGPGELPLLPEPVNGVRGLEIAKQAGEIIRAYFLRHYREPEPLKPLLKNTTDVAFRTSHRHG